MPITPGQEVKIRDTYPHKADGNPYETVGATDKALRGQTGTVARNDRKYDNFVEAENGANGYFYDHELEII